jgi:hypothetical protein
MLPLGHIGITVAMVRVVESTFQSPWVDYRWLFLASLLPDLIDKPLGYLFGPHSIVGVRHYGHSALFVLLLLLIALVQWYYRNNFTILTLCIGTFMHDSLDAVSHHHDWAEKTLFNTNMLMIFEMIGGCLLIYFFIGLVLPNKMEDFIKSGKL